MIKVKYVGFVVFCQQVYSWQTKDEDVCVHVFKCVSPPPQQPFDCIKYNTVCLLLMVLYMQRDAVDQHQAGPYRPLNFYVTTS